MADPLTSYPSWKGWKPELFGSYTPSDARYFELELRRCGAPIVAGLRVGEFGFGNGSLAGWVRDRGGRWSGIEANPILEERAREAGYEVVPPGQGFAAALGDGTLDLIVAFDVVEHLAFEDIRAFLTDARESLTAGGLLVIRCPSGDSPFVGPVQTGDVTHRSLLGSSAVLQLAHEAGMVVSQIRSPVLPIRGMGPRRTTRRLLARSAQAAIFYAIGHVLMGNPTAVVSPNMLAVLSRHDALV